MSPWLPPSWSVLCDLSDDSTDFAENFLNHSSFRNHFTSANDLLDHSSHNFPYTSRELLDTTLNLSDDSLWYLPSTVVFDDTCYFGNISEVKYDQFQSNMQSKTTLYAKAKVHSRKVFQIIQKCKYYLFV